MVTGRDPANVFAAQQQISAGPPACGITERPSARDVVSDHERRSEAPFAVPSGCTARCGSSQVCWGSAAPALLRASAFSAQWWGDGLSTHFEIVICGTRENLGGWP